MPTNKYTLGCPDTALMVEVVDTYVGTLLHERQVYLRTDAPGGALSIVELMINGVRVCGCIVEEASAYLIVARPLTASAAGTFSTVNGVQDLATFYTASIQSRTAISPQLLGPYLRAIEKTNPAGAYDATILASLGIKTRPYTPP